MPQRVAGPAHEYDSEAGVGVLPGAPDEGDAGVAGSLAAQVAYGDAGAREAGEQPDVPVGADRCEQQVAVAVVDGGRRGAGQQVAAQPRPGSPAAGSQAPVPDRAVGAAGETATLPWSPPKDVAIAAGLEVRLPPRDCHRVQPDGVWWIHHSALSRPHPKTASSLEVCCADSTDGGVSTTAGPPVRWPPSATVGCNGASTFRTYTAPPAPV